MYKIYKSILGEVLIRIEDNASIPSDEANTDYQEYLKWVEEGNIAEEYNPGGI
jgi:hypothetical protein